MSIKLVGGGDDLAYITAISLHGDEILELGDQPIDWVWEPSIASGSTITIGGPPSSGKSSLLFKFLVARAYYRPDAPLEVLGRPVTPAPENRYIFIIEEESRRRTAHRLRHAMRDFGLDQLTKKRIVKRFRFLTAETSVIVGDMTWNKISRLVSAGHVSDVVVDTLANSTTEEANSEKEQAALYKKFKKLHAAYTKELEETGPPPLLWLLAHTRKGEVEEDWATALAGSRQRAAQTDCLLMLKSEFDRDGGHTSSTCYIAKERDNMDAAPSKPIRFDAAGSVIQRRPGRPTSLSIKAILEELRKSESGLSITRLSELLHANPDGVKVLLEQAAEKNLVKRGDRIKNGIAFTIYSAEPSGN